ncbi:MAG: TRAP transporter small permease [Burkholderiaceae bacterium]
MKILDRLEEWIISLMLFAMTALAFMQVVRRYVFNTGFSWSLELTGVFFAVMIFVGVSYGVRVGSHIGVDALVALLGPQARRAVSILAVALCLVYVGFVLYGSLIYVGKMREVGVELEDMPIPRWWVLSIMPIGYALAGIRFLQIMFNLITGKTDSLHLADEAADAMKLKQHEVD